jgi:hypothetical protein
MTEAEVKREDFRQRRKVIYMVITEMDGRLSEFLSSHPVRHFWGAKEYAEVEALQNILNVRTSELKSIT